MVSENLKSLYGFPRYKSEVATDKLKKRHFIAFVAFLSLFWVAIKTTKIILKSDSLSLFCRFFCRFFVFFSNFLWFSDLKFFVFGRNPLTFVPPRPFLPDVTLLAQHPHDDSMPIISFLVFVYFKVQKKLFFFGFKKRQKKRQKSDKKRQNTDKHPNKSRTLEKSDSCRYFFWPVGAHPRLLVFRTSKN